MVALAGQSEDVDGAALPSYYPSHLPVPAFHSAPAQSQPERVSEDDAGFQFDIVSRSDASSFQAGYQGLQQRGFEAWLRGDVLLKRRSATHADGRMADFSQCTVELLATESLSTARHSSGRISTQVYHASHVLWRSPLGPSSSRSVADPEEIPGVMPFEFSLPEDLPHCVHLPTIKLEYRLIATLYPREDDVEQQPITKAVLVHVMRYSPPAPAIQLLPAHRIQSFSETPRVWQKSSPTDIRVQLSRTVYRRGEHMKIHVSMGPPHEKLVSKGLRVRSVEAELVRVVKPKDIKRPVSEQSNLKGKSSLRGSVVFESEDQMRNEGWQPHSHLLLDAEGGPGSSKLSTPSRSPISETPDQSWLRESLETPMQAYETVLSHSGKSCRFSLRRPLSLNLALVPPFSFPALPHPSPDHDAPPAGLSPLSIGTVGDGGGCESISQETEMSEVHFFVKVYIRMRGGQSPGDAPSGTSGTSFISQPSHDIQLETEVFVLPALAGARGVRDAEGSEEDVGSAHDAEAWQDQEEFDGYEDFRDSHDTFGDVSADQSGLDIRGGNAAQNLARVMSSDQLSGAVVVTNDVRPAESVHASSRSATTQRHDDSAEPPPTLQQSLHDLQIFPSAEAASEILDAPPPLQPEEASGRSVEVPTPPYGEGQRQHGTGSGSRPPAWSDNLDESSNIEQGTAMIDGVGYGQRRLGIVTERERRQSDSQPPDFFSLDSRASRTLGIDGDSNVPPPNFDSHPTTFEAPTSGAPDHPRRHSSGSNENAAGIAPLRMPNGHVQPPPYGTSSSSPTDVEGSAGNTGEDDGPRTSNESVVVDETSKAQPQGSSSRSRADVASAHTEPDGAESSLENFTSAQGEKARLAAAAGVSSQHEAGSIDNEAGTSALSPTRGEATDGPSSPGREHPPGLPPAYADSELGLANDHPSPAHDPNEQMETGHEEVNPPRRSSDQVVDRSVFARPVAAAMPAGRAENRRGQGNRGRSHSDETAEEEPPLYEA